MSRLLHFGYNTNGFAHHRLADALKILADLGYDSLTLTLDHCFWPGSGTSIFRQEFTSS